MIRFVALDRNGISRVWGEHQSSAEVAEARCSDEAREYLKRRPDCAPMTVVKEKE